MPDSEPHPFGEYLRRILKSRPGLSARKVAAYADVSPNTVNLWLRGVYVPRPESLAKLAPAIGMPLEDLMRAAGHLPGGVPSTAAPEAKVMMEVTADEASLIQTVRSFVRVPARRVREFLAGMYHADDELFYDWAYEKDQRGRIIEGPADETRE